MHAAGVRTISSRGVACRASGEVEARLHASFTSRHNGFTKPGMLSSALPGQEAFKLGSATRMGRISRYVLGVGGAFRCICFVLLIFCMYIEVCVSITDG